MRENSSSPAIMKMTLRMVRNLPYPRALRLAAWKSPLMASRNPLGLARGDPGEDAVEMSADHCGDFFHLLDLRAQHVAAPAVEQEACNVWLLAGEDLAQVLAVLPGACGARGGHLGEQPIELRALCHGERGAILQQHPALALEARVELLLDAAHLVDGFRGMGDDVELVEGDLGIGPVFHITWAHRGPRSIPCRRKPTVSLYLPSRELQGRALVSGLNAAVGRCGPSHLSTPRDPGK